MLKRYVKDTSLKQRRHPNSVWAELKRKYDFYTYKEIDCRKMSVIKHDLDLEKYLPEQNIPERKAIRNKSIMP